MSWLSSALDNLFGGGGGTNTDALWQQYYANLAQQQAAATAQAQQQAATEAANSAAATAAAQQKAQQDQATAAAQADAAAKQAAEDARVKAIGDYKAGLTSSFNQLLPSEFANTTLNPDAPLGNIETDIYGQNRAKADTFIQNMLKRGVITDVGAAAGTKNLEDQGARVRSQINAAGTNLAGAERANLLDIRNRGVTALGGISDVNQPFDPNVYAGQAKSSYDAFVKSLPDELKARVGTDLFDTTSLPSVAGAAQGAQNLPFDPSAISGGYDASAAAAAQQKKDAETGPKKDIGSSAF